MNNLFILAQAPAAPAQTTATQAQAEPGAQQPSFMQGFGGMVPFIIIIGAMFFLMWRSQSKERKRREEMLNSIKAGDRIMTAGGIYGTVDSINGNLFRITIAEGVKIEIDRTAVGRVTTDDKAEPAKQEKK